MFSFEVLDPYWKVLRLFIIPFGGGIPSGVLQAKSLNISWPITAFLYFISDILLAIIFEPIMIFIIKKLKKMPSMAKFSLSFKQALHKSTEHYGTNTGPLALIIVAFGVDPMTGRAVAKAAGHGFITGWMIAITGDMIYFSVIMASTLWVNTLLGDQGQTTVFLILFLMLILPALIRKIRGKFKH